MKQAFGVEPVLEVDGNGQFDVYADGVRVFSMEQCGGFPRPGQVTEAIRNRK